jgi:hypothetical protein
MDVAAEMEKNLAEETRIRQMGRRRIQRGRSLKLFIRSPDLSK